MPLDDTTLREYALGTLDSSRVQEVEHELAHSQQARAELRAIEESLGHLAHSTGPITPSEQVKTSLFASMNQSKPFAGFVGRLATFFDLGRERARELLDTIALALEGPWEGFPLPGTSLLHLEGGPQVAAAENCGLVRLEPSAVFPEHKHLGDEWALVLQGAAIDIIGDLTGEVSRPGDVMHRAPGTRHSFRSIDQEALVFSVVLYDGFEIVAS